MAIYLVDFENVKGEGLKGITELPENDTVIIFYSVNADKITFDIHQQINESKAHIDYYNAEIGIKNALDFQLVSFLGFLIAKEETQKFVIVSNDTGFSKVINFWKGMNFDVSLASDLTNTNKETLFNDMYFKVKEHVEDDKDAKLLTEYILKYKTKQGLNNAIVKVYGSQNGGKLYKSIKPLIQDKKGK